MMALTNKHRIVKRALPTQLFQRLRNRLKGCVASQAVYSVDEFDGLQYQLTDP